MRAVKFNAGGERELLDDPVEALLVSDTVQTATCRGPSAMSSANLE